MPYHTPIMVNEVLSLLLPQRGGIFVDGTLGGGGHAEAVLEAMPLSGRLIGIDRDAEAIKEASYRLKGYQDRFTAVYGNFFHLKELLGNIGVSSVDGILLDLGVSSRQLDAEERGFSYHTDAKLDMRMDQSAVLTAYDIVNSYSFEELARVLREYGEERYAGKIASSILLEREKEPIANTLRLSEIIKVATPPSKRYEGKHPARRSFQAIRIEVNAELQGLEEALSSALELLKEGGRMAVITFHSLEDRIVKQLFRTWEDPCVCPRQAPVCTCGKKPMVRKLNKKAIVPGQEEMENNARARSAKLRGIEKI